MSIAAPSYTHHQERQQYHHKQKLEYRNSNGKCYSENLTTEEASNDYDGDIRSVKNDNIFGGQYLDNQKQKRRIRRQKYNQNITQSISTI